jgi:hypothetical protein
MTTPDFAKLLADNWSSFFGAFIGACIASLVIQIFPPNVGRVRRQLGRALNRFLDVPSERLDAALLGTAAQRRWRIVRSILATTFCMGAAISSAALSRALFPQLHPWVSITICGLAAGVCAWLFDHLERRAILRRLARLHQQPLPNSPAA